MWFGCDLAPMVVLRRLRRGGRRGRPVLGGLASGGLAVALTASGSTYTVAPGDTLSEIAARLHIPVDELAAANGITDPDRIVAGQVLVLPGGRAARRSPPPPGPDTAGYVVRRGDTLSEIAERLGVPAAPLAEANGIDDPDLLREGMVLVLPGTGRRGGRRLRGPGGRHPHRRGRPHGHDGRRAGRGQRPRRPRLPRRRHRPHRSRELAVPGGRAGVVQQRLRRAPGRGRRPPGHRPVRRPGNAGGGAGGGRGRTPPQPVRRARRSPSPATTASGTTAPTWRPTATTGRVAGRAP